MADRLSQLHAELDAIRAAVAALEGRLSALEQDRTGTSTDTQNEVGTLFREKESRPRFAGEAFALTGRAFLAFGGAFVLRALTESQTVGPTTGVWLGVAYALAWLVAAALTSGAGRLVNGWLTLAIGLPLVLETAGRFRLLSPGAGLVAFTLLSAAPLLVAWHRGLPSLAAGASIGGALVGIALGLSTGQLVPYAAVNVGLGIGALWAAWHRDWRWLLWLSAGAIDLTVLLAALRACVRPPSEPPLASEFLLAGFGAAYLGSFVLRTLLHERSVRGFEIAQTTAVMLIGFGGAILVARINDLSLLAIGLPAAIAGVGLYAQSFVRVAARRGYGGDFHYYAFTAFGLLLGGVAVLLPGVMVPAVTGVAALMLAALAVKLGQTPFLLQAAIAMVVAAVESGLVRVVASSWTGHLDVWPAVGWAPAGVLAAAAVCYASPPVTRLERDAFSAEARVLLAGVIAGGLSSALLLVIGPAIAGRPPDAGVVATIRTVTLTVSAALLARLGRTTAWRELVWLAYGALALGGVKVLIEDVPRSRAATLFVALLAYGVALIVTPRLTSGGRTAQPPQAQQLPEPPQAPQTGNEHSPASASGDASGRSRGGR